MNRRGFLVSVPAAAAALSLSSRVDARPMARRATSSSVPKSTYHADGRLKLAPGKRVTKTPNEFALAPAGVPILKWIGPKPAPKKVIVHPGQLRPVSEVYGVSFNSSVTHGGGVIQFEEEGTFAVFYPTNGLAQAGSLRIEAAGTFPSGMKLLIWFMHLDADGNIDEGSVDGSHTFGAGGSKISVTLDTSGVQGGHQLRLDLQAPDGKIFSLRSCTLTKP